MAKKKDELIRYLDVNDHRGYSYAVVDIDLVLPDPENPRIPAQESFLETMLTMVRQDPDEVFNLAKDIVKMGGTNPAELLNVTFKDGYFVAKEGNRRA